MDVLQSTAATAAPNPSASDGAEARTSLTSDYEMFLQMLTTQMTNQDPLNPVDSSDYAVQLATFSSVEQQVLTNDLLIDLTSQLSASGLKDMAAYVGKDVRTQGPAYFEGTPIDIMPEIATGAESARLSVRNEAGDLVQEFELDPQGGGVSWAGLDVDGNPLPYGLYSFDVTLIRWRGSPEYRACGHICAYSRGTNNAVWTGTYPKRRYRCLPLKIFLPCGSNYETRIARTAMPNAPSAAATIRWRLVYFALWGWRFSASV